MSIELAPEGQRAEAESWKRWQEAWGNTESGAHAFGFAAGQQHERGLACNEITRLTEEVERLRKALNDAAGTGLIIYHIAKEHHGRARDCEEISCGLQRRTMEDFVRGPIIWSD